MKPSSKSRALLRAAPDGGVFDWLQAADGKRLRVAVWGIAQATRGTVLLLHGRREFIEKYHETIAELLQRGFAVATLDWRGQGLSDRLLADRHRGHAVDFADFVSDLDLFVSWVKARCPAPYMMMAHSMGGHIAARYLASGNHSMARAVLISPMIGVQFGVLPERAARLIARTAEAMGSMDDYALLQGAYTEKGRRAEGIILSSDSDRLEDEIIACRDNPDLALGGVTYGWITAALASIELLRQPGVAEAIDIPVLFALAENDRVVVNKQTQAFAARMKAARVVIINDARHEILKERDDIRAQFWAAFDVFTD